MADAVKAEKSKRRRKIPVNRVLLPRSGCFQFTASSRFILLKVRLGSPGLTLPGRPRNPR